MNHKDLITKLNKKMIDEFGLIISPKWIRQNKKKVELYIKSREYGYINGNVIWDVDFDSINNEDNLVECLFWMILHILSNYTILVVDTNIKWIVNSVNISYSMLGVKYSTEHILHNYASDMLKIIYKVVINYDGRGEVLKKYIMNVVKHAMELRASQCIELFFNNNSNQFSQFTDSQINSNIDNIVGELVEQDIRYTHGRDSIRTNFLRCIPVSIDGDKVYKGSVLQSYKDLKQLILNRTSYNILVGGSGWDDYVFINLLKKWIPTIRKNIKIINEFTSEQKIYNILRDYDMFIDLKQKLWKKYSTVLSQKYFSSVFDKIETSIMKSIDILSLEPSSKIKKYIKLNLIEIDVPDKFNTLDECINEISLNNTCNILNIDKLITLYNNNKIKIWNEIVNEETLRSQEINIDSMFSLINSTHGNYQVISEHPSMYSFYLNINADRFF